MRRSVAEINRRWRAAARRPQNKRASPRIDVELKVAIGGDPNSHTAITRNISVGGLFVATSNLRARGDRMMLTFKLPNSECAFVVDSEVRWIRESARDDQHQPSGMGLQFVDLAARTSAAINAFIVATT